MAHPLSSSTHSSLLRTQPDPEYVRVASGRGLSGGSTERSFSHEEEALKPTGPDHVAIGNHVQRPAGRATALFKIWWTEILSIAFSLGCIATNAGVLAAFDGRPYRSWRIAQADITPNAIISILATFTRASFLLTIGETIGQLKWLFFQARPQRVSDLQIFDDASRGPLGSLRLLWRINLHSAIASLSAFATILALATEPFTQQVVRYPTRNTIATNVSATLGTTHTLYFPSGAGEKQNTISEVQYLQQLNIAINSGIVSPAADPVYDCPSGSCAWPSYSSLAWYSSCEEIAPHMVVSCRPAHEHGDVYRLCTYSFGFELITLLDGQGPTRQVAWSLWRRDDSQETLTWHPTTLLNITMASINADDLDRIYVLRWEESYNDAGYANAPHDILPKVLDCAFFWSAHYYLNTTVKDGKLFEEPLITVPLKPLSSGDYIPTDSSYSLGTLRLNGHSDEIYRINDDFFGTFWATFFGVMNTRVFAPATDSDHASVIANLASSYRNDYTESLSDQASLGKRYAMYYSNNGNTPKTLDNVAKSVTNAIRSGMSAGNITGDVLYPTVYIEVVWAWLIYPAFLSLSGAVLLALTIWLSSGHDKMVWKSSTLALLFHGLPKDEADGRLLSIDSMYEAADDMWARLSGDGDGGVGMKML